MKVKDARSLAPAAQEALRMRVVRAVLGGMKQVEALRVFEVSRASLANWLNAYRRAGSKGLKAKPQGRPRGQTRLASWQAGQIVQAITDRTPDQLKLPFVLWTREAVAQLIEDRFGMRLSVWTVGRYLKRWGFTPQKPVRRAFEQNPQEVKHWLKVQYPRVRAVAKAEQAQIHWGDEMGLRSDHQAGTSYAPRGRTPVIAGSGQRWGCNMISSLSGRGELRFMVFKQRFTAKVFIEFMRRLIAGTGRKIYLIVDGHPVHKSGAVGRWVAQHHEQLRLILLPAYSPQLNPDEFLNHDVKQNALGRRRAASQAEMIADVRGYLRSTQRQPQIVKHYFHAPSVRYAIPCD